MKKVALFVYYLSSMVLSFRFPTPPIRKFAPSRMSRSPSSLSEHFTSIVFIRHGQSEWNEANRFTGWADVGLTTLGRNEAANAAVSMFEEGLKFDVAFTSVLKRAQKTLDIVKSVMGEEEIPVYADWRLNERMYGDLTGLDKARTTEKYGEAKVKEWRRSFSVRPPPVDITKSEYWPGNDVKYAHLDKTLIPVAESLKDTIERTLPFWISEIVPVLAQQKTVLVVAHGNSIRGMLKYLDNISDQDITQVEIPTGVPILYSLNTNLTPINSSHHGGGLLRGRFLTSAGALGDAWKHSCSLMPRVHTS